MPHYQYADTVIVSLLPLGELPVAGGQEIPISGLVFRLLTEPPPEPASVDWLHYWHTEAGDLTLSLARKDEGFLLRFPGLADFAVATQGGQISAWPAPGIDEETLRHLLLDQVLPRLLTHRGQLALHAGSIRVGNRIIAFVAPTGWGKSTLAASFHAAGYPLLSDDGLVLTLGENRAMALPTYPSLRLWPKAVASLFVETPAVAPVAHYSSKQRVVMEDAAGKASLPMPLAALYVLAPEAEAGTQTISAIRLSPRDACMAIISNAFQLDVTDRSRAAGLLAMASDVARQVPAFTLAFPRDFARLPEVHAAILKQREQWAGALPDQTAG